MKYGYEGRYYRSRSPRALSVLHGGSVDCGGMNCECKGQREAREADDKLWGMAVANLESRLEALNDNQA